jgi:hypothetical protein
MGFWIIGNTHLIDVEADKDNDIGDTTIHSTTPSSTTPSNDAQ